MQNIYVSVNLIKLLKEQQQQNDVLDWKMVIWEKIQHMKDDQ